MFWQPCGSARSVVVVEVNGYTIEPGADLSGADLEGVNLIGAGLRGANLTGARVNDLTIWPEGFDPEAAGVIVD